MIDVIPREGGVSSTPRRRGCVRSFDHDEPFYVYTLASKIGGTLYVGVTNDLVRRVAEHRLKVVEGFAERYNVVRLVYFEQFDDPENAIKREKRAKKWNRAWKIRLIKDKNPNWDDLYLGIAGSD